MKIVIGTEANQYVPQQVLIYSIRQSMSLDAEILPTTQQAQRIGGTNFGFVRFMVPSMCGYQGRAVYLDADQLVFTDIKELFEQIDDSHAIACVQDAEGTFGGKVIERANQTSVMVLNCDKLRDWDPETMFDKVVPNRTPLAEGQIHYRNFMKLDHMDQSRIQPLDPRWNHYNIVRDDTKLVHFSHVRSQPWKSPEHPLTDLWSDWLVRAMRAGYLSRFRLLREIAAGHLDKHFLKHVYSLKAAA
ncbi:MAG: glycosyltransferase [Tistlia sp.]|uniref:glycosyltransferase n=1 Tax=Tistlia sp. TaxID=3057121 RepID=UPI0034A24EB5